MKKAFRDPQHWVMLYDIRHPRRLARVARIMSSYGWRVQKSVFESDADEQTMAKARARLEKVINSDEDFIIIMNICESDWPKQEKHGQCPEPPQASNEAQIL